MPRRNPAPPAPDMGAVRESRRVWVMATVVAVLVVAGVVALFRPPGATPPRRGVMVKPTVEIPPSGASALDERAVFKDPGPLFLPTRWNCVPPKMEGNEPKGEFAGYEAKYAFSVNDLNLNLPPATQVPKSPAEPMRAAISPRRGRRCRRTVPGLERVPPLLDPLPAGRGDLPFIHRNVAHPRHLRAGGGPRFSPSEGFAAVLALSEGVGDECPHIRF